MKHIKTWTIPDCPNCGKEMKGVYKRSNPTEDHPFGKDVDGWWFCESCGYESEHFNYKPYDRIDESEVKQ